MLIQYPGHQNPIVLDSIQVNLSLQHYSLPRNKKETIYYLKNTNYSISIIVGMKSTGLGSCDLHSTSKCLKHYLIKIQPKQMCPLATIYHIKQLKVNIIYLNK